MTESLYLRRHQKIASAIIQQPKVRAPADPCNSFFLSAFNIFDTTVPSLILQN